MQFGKISPPPSHRVRRRPLTGRQRRHRACGRGWTNRMNLSAQMSRQKIPRRQPPKDIHPQPIDHDEHIMIRSTDDFFDVPHARAAESLHARENRQPPHKIDGVQSFRSRPDEIATCETIEQARHKEQLEQDPRQSSFHSIHSRNQPLPAITIRKD